MDKISLMEKVATHEYEVIIRALEVKKINTAEIKAAHESFINFKALFSPKNMMSLDDYEHSVELLDNLNIIILKTIRNNFE